jgi:hypothetical protein
MASNLDSPIVCHRRRHHHHHQQQQQQQQRIKELCPMTSSIPIHTAFLHAISSLYYSIPCSFLYHNAYFFGK